MFKVGSLRATLSYYATAWAVGCFIVSLVVSLSSSTRWWGGRTLLRQFPGTYLWATLLGSLDVLLFAFLLRALMRYLRSQVDWVWLVAGASVAFVMTFVLTRMSQKFRCVEEFPRPCPPPLTSLSAFFDHYPAIRDVWILLLACRELRFWQASVAGGIIAIVLCLVASGEFYRLF